MFWLFFLFFCCCFFILVKHAKTCTLCFRHSNMAGTCSSANTVKTPPRHDAVTDYSMYVNHCMSLIKDQDHE